MLLPEMLTPEYPLLEVCLNSRTYKIRHNIIYYIRQLLENSTILVDETKSVRRLRNERKKTYSACAVYVHKKLSCRVFLYRYRIF